QSKEPKVFFWHKLDPLLGGTLRGRQPRQFGTFLTQMYGPAVREAKRSCSIHAANASSVPRPPLSLEAVLTATATGPDRHERLWPVSDLHGVSGLPDTDSSRKCVKLTRRTTPATTLFSQQTAGPRILTCILLLAHQEFPDK